jgi:Tol biopolymer transport system component
MMPRPGSLLALLIVSVTSCTEPGVSPSPRLSASAETTKTREPLLSRSIVFTREQPEGGCDLFTIESDGTSDRALTDTASTCETVPSVAPGGSMVAVSLDLDDIALIDLATSALRRLTDDPTTFDGSPAWSPDASQIAFFRGPPLGPSHLHVMDSNGTDLRQLTQRSGSDRNAAWSSGGTRIAFARSGNDGYEVYVMDADGANVTAVTSVAAESAPSPAWSPDGSRIALDVNGAIYVVSIDGTGLRRLSPALPKGVLDMSPSWSPDGAQIAFMRYTNDDVADTAEDGDIWIVDVDDTDATRVTRGPAIDDWPEWVSGSVA